MGSPDRSPSFVCRYLITGKPTTLMTTNYCNHVHSLDPIEIWQLQAAPAGQTQLFLRFVLICWRFALRGGFLAVLLVEKWCCF